MTQPHRLRRSLLYVPGNMPSMLQNIPVFQCDVCVIDLEDAVPRGEKDAARLLSRRFIEGYTERNKEIYVRINGLDTPYFRDDLAQILPVLPDGVRLPKCETPSDLRRLDDLLTEFEEYLGCEIGRFKIIAGTGRYRHRRERDLRGHGVMSKNSLGREIPETWGGRALRPYRDPFSVQPEGPRVARPIQRVNPGDRKLLGSLREAIEASGLRDDMTISAHHHLHNGDLVLNSVVREIAALGIRDITVASSSVHPVHEALIPFIG